MKPYEFEQLVCDHYRQKGYRVQTTSASNDYLRFASEYHR